MVFGCIQLQLAIPKKPSRGMTQYMPKLDVPLDVRIDGDRISGFFHPNESPIYKDRWK